MPSSSPPSSNTQQEAVLSVQDLRVSFKGFAGTAKVLEGVSLEVHRGQRVGLVGESGCGKSVTMKTVMGTLATPPAQIDGGQVLYRGSEQDSAQDLLRLSPSARNALKGRDISMIFQDPMTALNPVFRIGEQLDDIIRYADRRGVSGRGGQRRNRRERKTRVVDVLGQVRLPDPQRIYNSYPMQLSGGMRQRVLIAMALLNEPTLLIADEPGTALDVTTQDEILNLLNDLVVDKHLALLMITHNLGVVREMTDVVYVMYAGRIIESGPTAELFAAPHHPYTKALLACVPKLSGEASYEGIPGTLPDYRHPPAGCRFHPRCTHAMSICQTRPAEVSLTKTHQVACWLYDSQHADQHIGSQHSDGDEIAQQQPQQLDSHNV
ncbi:MAG: ABC transporter ATP-binding protein [Deinococcota bacterium]